MAMYHVCLVDGTLFTDVSDTTMLQMMEKLDVDSIASADSGELLYCKPQKSAKVGGITRAFPYMVMQSFIYSDGAVKDYVMENQPEEDAKSWLSLTRDNPKLATYCKEYGGLLTSVVVFRKTRGGYEQIGRVDF